jgi:hypothetical protein
MTLQRRLRETAALLARNAGKLILLRATTPKHLAGTAWHAGMLCYINAHAVF